MMKQNQTFEKGITLIALVLTIIVLLILAGIAISMISGENGLLKKAADSKVESERQQRIEKIKLAVTAAMMNEEHKIDKEKLEEELNKYFGKANVEESDGFIITIGENDVYQVDENGILVDNKNETETEDEIIIENETKQSSTGVLTLDSSVGYDLIDYKIYGNSVQDGTPTPETPIEIKSVGDYDEVTGKYKIPVRVRGKNFFNIDKLTNNNYIIKDEDGSITVSKYGVSTSQTLAQLCPELKVGDKVRLSFVSNAELDGVPLGLTYLNGANVNWRNRSLLTITQAHLDSKFTFYCSRNDGVNIEAYYKDMQIEYDTVTDYEPYVEPITTNIYLNEPLRAIGEHKDYIDFKNKKVVRKIYREFINSIGGKSSLSGTYTIFLTEILKKPFMLNNNQTGLAISNKFKQYTEEYGNLIKYPSSIQSYITSGGLNRIACTFGDSSIKTPEQAQEKIGDGFEVCYVLDKEITEENVELPNIPTHKGTNIIEVDTEVKPSSLEIEYAKSNN